MAISLNKSIAGLQVLSNLDRANATLSQTYERLSSGLRINSASDDPAGLALASSLNADARIYGQAARNINEGVSMLSMAEAALSALASIAERNLEIATQAANSSFTLRQRQALQTESDALIDEYNRILSTTSYNGISLLNSAQTSISIQAGAGSANAINVTLGSELSEAFGNGTFSAGVSYTVPVANDMSSADLNGDGNLDLVTAGTSGAVHLLYGNGNGTFQAVISLAAGGGPSVSTELVDVNGDSFIDIVSVSNNVTIPLNVMLNQGNGTFSAAVSYLASVGSGSNDLAAGDVNGDGSTDILITNSSSDLLILWLGNGNGSFGNETSYTVGDTPFGAMFLDFNSDGNLDIAVAETGTSDTIGILLGNGNGTFRARASYSAADGTLRLANGDLNRDGIQDLVTANLVSDTISVFLGNSDGSFKASVSYAAPDQVRDVQITDFNADGFVDVIGMGNGTPDAVFLYLGNGNGSLQAPTSLSNIPTDGRRMVIDDFNGDGVADVTVGSNSDTSVYFYRGLTTETPRIGYVNILSVADAQNAMGSLQDTIDRVTLEQGKVAASLSRLEVAYTNALSLGTLYSAAHDRITEIDTAQEVARMLRAQILQQASTAVLAQANQSEKLVLSLLA